MKPRDLILILALFTALVLLVSCAGNPPQVTAYQTIGQIDSAATVTIDQLDAAAIRGLIPTNDIPKASQAYNDLHQALLLASISAEQGTNAIAPANLQTNLFNLTMLAASIMAQKH